MIRSVLTQVAALLAAAWVLAWVTYGPVSGGALLGFDSYPLIAASQVNSAGDLFRTFGDELMGGRYPDGRFYRPLVHLSIGLDHALGGLDPSRFARTDIALVAISATLLGLLAGSLAGTLAGALDRRRSRSAAIAACSAAALFILHRAQLEVVPYAPRRADALAVLFVAAAALAARRGARPGWTAALTLCALLSKESGVIALPVVIAAAGTRPGTDLRTCARAAIGPALGLAIGLAARTAVLGGLGGHAESGAPRGESLGSMSVALWRAVSDVIPGGGPLFALLAAAGLAALLLQAEGRGKATASLLVVWIAAGLLITSVSGRFHDWYALTLVAPLSVLAGAATGSRRVGPLFGAMAVALVAIGQARSPQRATLAVAQAVSQDQAERFQALLHATPSGGTATFEPWVFAISTAPGAPPIFVHAPYSLSALAELTLKGQTILLSSGTERPLPTPDQIQVQLVPGPPPPATLAPR